MAGSFEWQRVAGSADVPAGEPFGATYGDRAIVLVRDGHDILALAGICPHAYALMSEGFLSGAEIECPLHAAIFDVRSGKCLDGPAGTGDLATFEVKIEGGDVLVRAKS